ncbi:MAG: peptidoglycan bridge formation glycyltransferase FemA/FemB family protein [Candidatus Levybacteria bacterium]|nr:peptidoglycan bridge formation glycyltransferase FemA/FemB family protein [Candidatus Levybacteria bacterium]
MKFLPLSDLLQKQYNKLVTHPLQSYEWGTFREKTGLKVIREGKFDNTNLVDGFTMTLHKVPKTIWSIGYVPKGVFPDKKMLDELRKIGKREKCIFIQLEPNVLFSKEYQDILETLPLKKAAHPLFTKYTFLLDLTKSEDELLKMFHPKTRYNIKVAQKYNVSVSEKNTDEAFTTYLNLMKETTKRQKFYAHSLSYHTAQWQTLKHTASSNELSSHLLIANYNMKTLAAWVLFVFKDTLYYPYGASSSEHRETMASTLMMWEAIKFGKKLGLKKFDMWGALGPEPDQLDPWFGFHRFKQGFRPSHVEFIGSYDLVINPLLYQLYVVSDKLRSLLLQIK